MGKKRPKVQKDNVRIQVNFSPSEIKYLELLGKDFQGLTIGNTNRLLLNYLIDNNISIYELKKYIELSSVRSIKGNYKIKQLNKLKQVESLFKAKEDTSNAALEYLNHEVKTIFDLVKELENND